MACTRSFATSPTAAPRRTRSNSRRLGGEARLRRLLGVQGAVRRGSDRGWVSCARATSSRGCPPNPRAALANCCRTVGHRQRLRADAAHRDKMSCPVLPRRLRGSR
jgi:hypothetical protein